MSTCVIFVSMCSTHTLCHLNNNSPESQRIFCSTALSMVQIQVCTTLLILCLIHSYPRSFFSLLSPHKSHHPLDLLPSGPYSQPGSKHRRCEANLSGLLWVDRTSNLMHFNTIQEPVPLSIPAHPFLVRMIPKHSFPLESYSNSSHPFSSLPTKTQHPQNISVSIGS